MRPVPLVRTSIRSGIGTTFRHCESVVLYAEAGALPATALEDLITQARNVDMQQVHADIAVQAK